MTKTMRALAMVVALAAATRSVAGETQVLRVASTPTGVPFTFLDARTNSVQGVMIDLMRAIAKDQGLSVDIQPMPFSTLIPSLTSAKIDLICAALGMTPQRAEVVAFTDPVYAYGEGMVVNAKDPTPYRRLEDLKGAVVGTQVGTVYVEPMRKTGLFSEVKVYDSLADVLRDVGLGRIKAGFGDFPMIAYQVSRGVHKDVRLVRDHEPIVEVKIAMAVRKGDDALRSRLNASLAKLKADGTLEAILAKWGLK